MRALTADTVRRAFTANAPEGRTLLPDTNFFEAGFTSTRLTVILAELVAAGIELTLVDLFRYPTLSALIGELEARAVDGPLGRGLLPWESA